MDGCAQPVEVDGAYAVQPRRNVRSLRCEVELAVIADDGPRQQFRRISAQRVINIGKMLAIQLIKLPVVGGMVLGPVPPVPIAALRNEQFFKGKLLLLSRHIFRIGTKEIARGRKMVPGKVVFRCTDPHIEVGIDPRAGNKGRKFFWQLASLEGLRDGQGLKGLLILYAIVQAAKKFTT